MQKNKLSRYFIFLSILTFLGIFVMLVQQSYDNLKKATIEVQKSPLIRPIDPNLDVEVLNLIEQQKEFSP